MPPLVREHPVVMTFEFLLLGAFLWALYMGLRAEWKYRTGGYPRTSLKRGATDGTLHS